MEIAIGIISYRGAIGIMENNMEIAIQGLRKI